MPKTKPSHAAEPDTHAFFPGSKNSRRRHEADGKVSDRHLLRIRHRTPDWCPEPASGVQDGGQQMIRQANR